MEKVISGIRPTGNLHLGNYFGAVKSFLQMQNDYDCMFFIADWHSLTTHPTPADIKNAMDRAILQMFEPKRFLGLVHDSIVFDAGVKKVMRPNQIFALDAAKPRIAKKESGIIWHTQGSGKSLMMVWLAQWIRENQEDARVVIITDRDELDKQITNGFREAGEKPHING